MINKYKKILKNKDAKVLLENFISLSSLQVVNLILPLVTLPYITRVLGFDLYGVVVLASSLVLYFQTITDYSFKITAVRDVSVFRNSPIKLSLIYSKVMYVKCFFLALSLFSLSLIILFVPIFRVHSLIFFLSTLTLIGDTLFPEWFFQGIEKMKYLTLSNVIIKGFFSFSVLFFIKKPEDYWLYPLLNSAGYIVVALIGQYTLFSKHNLKLVPIRFVVFKRTIRNNFPIFLNQLLPTLYNNSSGFILGVVAGNYWIGIYSALRRVIDVSLIILNIISRVFFPYMNRNKHIFLRYVKLMSVIGICLTILPIILYLPIKWYLNLDYEYSFAVTTILSFGILGLTTYNIFGLNYFIVKRQDKLVMKNTLLVSILSLVLAYPLISSWGVVGAAINLSLSRGIMGGGLFYKYLKGKNK